MSPQKVLPAGYREVLHLDLEHDKKLSRTITLIAVLIIIVMGIIGNNIRPIVPYFRVNLDQVAYIFLGTILYIVLHELVHGLFMRLFSGTRPHYGVTGIFGFAGSKHYFDRDSYVIIALSPIVIWGAILAFLCSINLHTKWFWTYYFIEMVNLSGIAGDLYVFWQFSKHPEQILIQDLGSSMKVYAK